MKSEKHILQEMCTNCNCEQCTALRYKTKHRARRSAKWATRMEAERAVDEISRVCRS